MALQSLIDKPKELIEFIADRLKPKDIEKTKFGEVFTPLSMVEEMLDKLDEYHTEEYGKSIFSIKKYKWYDPCCGMGNFQVILYQKLMTGLEEKIPDEKERKRHILENMIYVSEINKKNIFVFKQLFDINGEYELNIYNGDSLDLDTKTIFNIDKFDIILGNPPYNAPGTKATGNTIWQKFVLNAIELLIDDGYLLFIHPCGWRKPNTEKGKFYGLFDKMSNENTMLWIDIHNTKDGMKNFKCGTRYDWYVMQKKENENTKTTIRDEDGKIFRTNLNRWNWLPNGEFELIYKLIRGKEKCDVLYLRTHYGADKKWISKTKTKEYKYPVVHSTPKDGTRFVYSSVNDRGFFGESKVIFGESGINEAIIDNKGEYGMSHGAMAISFNDIHIGEKIKTALETQKFKNMLKYCAWSVYRIEWGMFCDFSVDFYKEFIDEE